MVIESRYWREQLRLEISELKRKQSYRRWTEKQLVLYERKLMLVAFQVRSLLERPKVNDTARRTAMPVIRYKKVGDRPFTYTGSDWPEDCFDMDHPEKVQLSAIDVCNQLIHYYWMQTWSEGTKFSGMLVFSDYMRHKCAYEFRIDDLLGLFQAFSQDSSVIIESHSRWNEKKQDYVVFRAISPADA
ncbi:hypothetical protein ACG0Z6_11580 [Roseateles sp. BYS180W]|uniref:Uncharacterized protein n=1 Tax=Roseateles rivi TaxID=3299028 RepID=A0ABW7FX19_9BURK